ncbi:MAG TPA: hypothetical protein VFH06_00130 [Candidatus Saccharimonadales bacterium]|nr:hypothetical protein [Candidatus Saccharimonadales bacterium]
MAKIKNHAPTFKEIFNGLTEPGYDRPEGEERESRSESRLRKWGKRILAGTLAGGILAGAGYGLDQLSKSERTEEVAQMNERFEPALKPTAEKTARFVMDKVEAMNKNGWDSKSGIASVTEDSSNSANSILSYSKEVNGGEYRVRAVVGEDAQGKPDVTQVKSAEIWETNPKTDTNPGINSVVSIAKDDPVFNKGYWGASVTFNDPSKKTGGDGLDSYNTYNYRNYDDLDKDVERAQKIAGNIDKELDKIDKSTPIY